MAKIYAFNSRTDTITTPWTQITAWNGRYVRLSAAYADHGTLVGASTHTHAATITIDEAAATLIYYTGSNLPQHTYTRQHTHGQPTWTVSSENNDPAYYDLALMSCDYTYWENTERRFPLGTIVFADTGGLSDSEWDRFTGADGRFVRIAGTPGGTGGRFEGVSTHTVTGTLSNYQETQSYGPNALNNANSGSSFEGTHNHTLNLTSNQSAVYPRWIATRAYIANRQTTHAPAGIIVFVDATPSSNFQATNWATCNLTINNVDPITGGSDTHAHAVAGNTSAYNGTGLTTAYWTAYGQNYWDKLFVPNGHVHYAHGTLDSVSAIPLSVTMVAVKLKTTLYHVETKDKTYDTSMVLRKTQNKTYGSSIRVKGTGVAIYTPDMLLKKIMDLTYQANMILAKPFDEEILMSLLLKKVKTCSYTMDLRLPKNSVTYGASLRVIKPYGPTDTVINTLYHSWVDQFDKIDQKLQLLQIANRIDWAESSALDDRWGTLMDLPRMTGESDESYRKRLSAYVQVLTGCGTKANVESILDFLVDEVGVSRVVQGPPGKIRVYFDSDTAVRTAKEREALINNLMPKMIATGIEYQVYYPFLDYHASMLLKGPKDKTYGADMLLSKADVDFYYYMRLILVSPGDAEYEADMLLRKLMSKTYRAGLEVKRIFIKTYLSSTRLLATKEDTYQVSMNLKAVKDRTCSLDMLLLKHDLQTLYKSDLLLKKGRNKTYHADMGLKKTLTSTYGSSMLVVAA
jgi:hypothetical protein